MNDEEDDGEVKNKKINEKKERLLWFYRESILSLIFLNSITSCYSAYILNKFYNVNKYGFRISSNNV